MRHIANNPHEQDYIGRALDLGALIVPMSSCQLDKKTKFTIDDNCSN
jgi:hypothetical protein